MGDQEPDDGCVPAVERCDDHDHHDHCRDDHQLAAGHDDNVYEHHRNDSTVDDDIDDHDHHIDHLHLVDEHCDYHHVDQRYRDDSADDIDHGHHHGRHQLHLDDHLGLHHEHDELGELL